MAMLKDLRLELVASLQENENGPLELSVLPSKVGKGDQN